MPPQSRAQRRRQAARQQQQQPRRPAPPRNLDVGRDSPPEDAAETSATGPTIMLGAPPTATEPRRMDARQAARGQRRVLSRPAPEPVDYSKDYAAVRRDLRWIAVWTVLLFIGMVALKFSGLV